MKIAIVSFTEQGADLSRQMREVLSEYQVILYTGRARPAADREGRAYPVPEGEEEAPLLYVGSSLKAWCGQQFGSVDALIFIGAVGIAVRTIAPFLGSKTTDPAVLAADEKGHHLISLLSGHLGGGNALTRLLAEGIGADPVITTASDVNGKLAIDVWAQKNRLQISDMKLARRAAADIVAGRSLPFFCQENVCGVVPEECEIYIPESRTALPAGDPTGETSVYWRDTKTGDIADARAVLSAPGTAVWIGPCCPPLPALHLIPRCISLGIGCRKGKTAEEILAQVQKVCRALAVAPESIEKICSVDLKAGEKGLQQAAAVLQVPFETYPAEALAALPGTFTASPFVSQVVGTDNVCERSAVMGLPAAERQAPVFLCRKQAENGITVAMTMRKWEVSFE